MTRISIVPRLPELCQGAIAAARNIGIDLDVSALGVEKLESFLGQVDIRELGELERAERVADLSLRCGAFLGEVVRRELGGDWHDVVPGRDKLGPAVELSGHHLFPMYAVSARLTRSSPNVAALYENWRAAVELSPIRMEAPEGSIDRDMLAFAEQAAMDVQENVFEWLDYSVDSLALLDRWLQLLRSDASVKKILAGPVGNVVALKLGSYLGEIVRRHLGGSWVRNEPGLPPEVPAVSTGGFYVVAAGVMMQFIQGGGVLVSDRPIYTVRDYFDAVRSVRQSDLQPSVSPGESNPEELRRSMSDDPALAHALYDAAAAAVLTAQTKWGLSLDFSEASLAGLENILAELHDACAAPSAPDVPRPTNDQIAQVASTWGVYLGEVVRRHHGGKWVDTPIEDQGPVLRLDLGSMALIPSSRILRRIRNGPGENVHLFYKALSLRLQQSWGDPGDEGGAVASDELRAFVEKAVGLAIDFGKGSPGPVSSFLLIRKTKGDTMESYAALDSSQAMVLGRKRASAQPEDTHAVVFVYDGTITEGGVKQDAFMAEAHERGASASFVFGQRYEMDVKTLTRERRGAIEVFATGRPILA